jgi:hypothetical protein
VELAPSFHTCDYKKLTSPSSLTLKALVVALKSVSSCTDKGAFATSERFDNKILNGGCITSSDGVPYCYVGDGTFEDGWPQTIGRCQRAEADYVFEFIGFIFSLGLIVLGFLAYRRGGASSRSYA